MLLHGVRRDEKSSRDLFRRGALQQMPHDLTLAAGEAECVADRWRQARRLGAGDDDRDPSLSFAREAAAMKSQPATAGRAEMGACRGGIGVLSTVGPRFRRDRVDDVRELTLRGLLASLTGQILEKASG